MGVGPRARDTARRRALPAPVGHVGEGRAPASEREEVFADLFAEVLGLSERPGTEDGFFDLGGDSIIAIQLVSRARQAGLIVTPREVFQHQTVAALAELARDAGEDDAVEAEPEGAGIGPVPVTPIVAWLRERSGAEVAPPSVGSQAHPPIMNAPGRYVLEK